MKQIISLSDFHSLIKNGDEKSILSRTRINHNRFGTGDVIFVSEDFLRIRFCNSSFGEKNFTKIPMPNKLAPQGMKTWISKYSVAAGDKRPMCLRFRTCHKDWSQFFGASRDVLHWPGSTWDRIHP